MDDVRALLEGWPVVIEVPVAWGDMDAFQHVNNTVYFRYCESARIAFLDAMGYRELMEASSVGPILASTACRFRFPLTFPDTVLVGARVTEVLEDRFAMHYLVVSRQARRVAAEAEAVVVAFDYAAGNKVVIPQPWQAALQRVMAQAHALPHGP